MIINLVPYERKSSYDAYKFSGLASAGRGLSIDLTRAIEGLRQSQSVKTSHWVLHHPQSPHNNNNIEIMTREEHRREHQSNVWLKLDMTTNGDK